MIYPELDIDKCLIIPRDQQLREKVSTVWKAPQIYFSGAQKVKHIYIYVIVCGGLSSSRSVQDLCVQFLHFHHSELSIRNESHVLYRAEKETVSHHKKLDPVVKS